ncbi:ATP-binding protein [Aspergillus ruber CBS 135680]|uniref:P-loop containing nucleoside triphosphate hydrolase protein n=1 Tax=Aspergillus ruber (strain CBS 135680) TaxID=1388766 RepID=A0A017S1T1_ASPRC|nr:uncharacterized protein EURHEDRAFT_416916 [Aspergillus ruber CBS 135680]EYE91008.1 hypothetical protein EURHEDRAFT_416916 [Aspergillus ruber CBS 135680]
MAAAITSWVLNPIQSLTMSRPRTRKLWCTLSHDLQQSFPMECVADKDDIDILKKKIWDRLPARFEYTLTDYSELKLYSPVVQLNHEEKFRIEHGEFLYPRRMITSLFPESKDPDVDIVVVSGGATPQKRKRSESQNANIPWTLPIAEHRLICPRERTVSQLAAILDDMNIVHVRGTPASGKTRLSELLRDYYRKEGRKAFLIKKWEELDSEDPWGSFIELVKKRNKELENVSTTGFTVASLQSEHDLSWILTSNTVIIVDEAQTTYSDDTLWNTIFKERLTPNVYKFQLCLFCSYGSPAAGPDPTFFTPVKFSDEQRISLTPQNQQDSPPIGLFYDKEEFRDVVSRLLTFHYEETFNFDEGALEYIFAVTSGHPGAVTSVVDVIYEAYRHDIKHEHVKILTEDHVIWFLEDTATVFKLLRTRPVNRSFPDISRATNGNVATLSKITGEGSIPFDINDASIKFCYQNGWIHRVALDDGDVAVLPSRLHEKYIEYWIGKMSMPLPARFDSLPKLCKEILREFSIMILRHSAEGKKMSTASQPRPVEAQYQDEFHRGFVHVVGPGVPISSEWSRTKDGRVDFYIPEKKWAIELLRDHDKVDEHIFRFKEGGKYHSWLKENMVKDWIIIDCATSLPTRGFSEPRLWHAVFINDYSGLQLYNHQEALIMSVHLHI